MATLENFLRTGQLGPVVLGMTPPDVLTLVGDADEMSRKSNPLLLKYGAAEFSFSKSPHDSVPLLRRIAINYTPTFKALPAPLAFADWMHTQPPPEEWFKTFVSSINYLPVQSLEGPEASRLIFLSGVVVVVAGGIVHSISIDARERDKTTRAPVSHEREPKSDEILAMFDEANRAMQADADRAALLIAWAGLEAALRYRVMRLSPNRKVRGQPATLIQELFSAAELDSSQHKTLEEIRQLRSAVAHGLAPVKFDIHTIGQMRTLAVRLLGAAVSSH